MTEVSNVRVIPHTDLPYCPERTLSLAHTVDLTNAKPRPAGL